MAAINQIITGGIGPGAAIKYFELDGLSPAPSSNPILTASAGAYTITGVAVTFAYYNFTAAAGSYSLTGYSAALRWSGAPASGGGDSYHLRLRLRS